MEKTKKKVIELCFKYHSCKLCPRNAKCEKELEKEERISYEKNKQEQN